MLKRSGFPSWEMLLPLLILLLVSGFARADSGIQARHGFRILHVMSFHSPYIWTDRQLEGFKAGLGTSVRAEFKVFQLDTKRQSSAEEQAHNADQALQLIKSWKPDLVYVSDDDAVKLVAARNTNAALPFVFSGMNRSLKDHGLENARNITGVLEREHVLESIHLLQALKPGIRRIQILSDQGSYWPQVIARIQALANSRQDFELAGVSQPLAYADFQRAVLGNPGKADAYIILGNFNFKDAQGHDVPYPELQKWMAENSKLPDISFWEDRMLHGTLAGVAVSAFEQGAAAGRLARSILIDHQSPARLPVTATTKGQAILNLERARQLGITPRASLLLSARTIKTYEWNK